MRIFTYEILLACVSQGAVVPATKKRNSQVLPGFQSLRYQPCWVHAYFGSFVHKSLVQCMYLEIVRIRAFV